MEHKDLKQLNSPLDTIQGRNHNTGQNSILNHLQEKNNKYTAINEQREARKRQNKTDDIQPKTLS